MLVRSSPRPRVTYDGLYARRLSPNYFMIHPRVKAKEIGEVSPSLRLSLRSKRATITKEMGGRLFPRE